MSRILWKDLKRERIYLQSVYIFVEAKYGELGLADKVIINKCWEKAIEFFLPEFKERDKVPKGMHTVDLHNQYLKEYGLNYY